MSWISKLSEGADRPEDLELALRQIENAWSKDLPDLQSIIENFPLGANALCRLLSHSPVSVEKIVRNPNALIWLADSEVCASSRGKHRMELDWKAMKRDGDLSALRRFKAWELLRIALREVAGISDILETGNELSSIAEIGVGEIYESIWHECVTRWGTPNTELVILGMGKLGGEELNYSSDIDLIAFYGEEGEIRPGFSNQEFFNRMMERLLNRFAEKDAEGSLFRVDLRLRPEGSSGPLTRSMTGMENYYAGFGETWERMALIKARRVGGSHELAYDYERMMQAFVYPKTVSLDVVDEVAAIKARIERDILEPDELYRNVKLGRGGIREIEFTVQTLQLLHGARHIFLQERNTLRALAGLAELNFLPDNDAQALRSAYIFLRKVEHRLQIAREEQTHTIPSRQQDLHYLALSLEFPESSSFLEILQRTMQKVRSIFERVLADNSSSQLGKKNLGEKLQIFDDPQSAGKMLEKLGSPDRSKHVSPRTRQLYERLQPMLLEQLERAAEPDSALAGFVDFVEAYGIRGMLFETLAANPRVLELFIKLFDASYFLTRAVVRRPQWIEEIARGGELGLTLNVNQHREAMLSFQTMQVHDSLNLLRVYRQYQVLRIGLRDILGFCDLMELQQEYSDLAEACLLRVVEVLGLQEKITVVAMGKFGGQELCYGSDLDIVIISDDQPAAMQFLKEMKRRSEEGLVFPTDVRLRPEGDAAPIATSLETYKKYFAGRAQFWEIQALTKARIICGPLKVEVENVISEILRDAQNTGDLLSKVSMMHQRVVENRSGTKDAFFFKTGRGGLMALEFLVQALELLHGVRAHNTVHALDIFENKGILNHAKEAKECYLFLRKVEICLRRIEDTSISQLPSDEKKQRELALRLGFSDTPSFFKKYHETRSDIERLFNGVFAR